MVRSCLFRSTATGFWPTEQPDQIYLADLLLIGRWFMKINVTRYFSFFKPVVFEIILKLGEQVNSGLAPCIVRKSVKSVQMLVQNGSCFKFLSFIRTGFLDQSGLFSQKERETT